MVRWPLFGVRRLGFMLERRVLPAAHRDRRTGRFPLSWLATVALWWWEWRH